MVYAHLVNTPLGDVLATGEGDCLTGLWFVGQKYEGGKATAAQRAAWDRSASLPLWQKLDRWLTAYFAKEAPAVDFVLRPVGTPFQQEVWALLQKIPYGQTTTYGALAKYLADQRGGARFSAQAVGNAVGHNPISILIPCHRVVGSNGSLTGYAGGVEKKAALLRLEGADMRCLTMPTRGTAL